jgi:transcription termination/antitermination protein NusA
MHPEVERVIEQVSKEKGISKALVIDAVEDSMRSAARKQIGMQFNIEVKYNPEVKELEVFKVWKVVPTVVDPYTEVTLEDARQRLDPEAELDDELLEKLDPSYGRIAAQAAKQNLMQRLRDAEREIIFNEFKNRKEEIVSGIVTRFERKNLIVQLRPNVDAILPEKEQIPRERYRPQDRIRAYVLDVDMTSKGPQIVLSRTHPGFLKKAFEQEVPEIYEGIVEIKAVAREPGGRAKIAVISNDSDVDPVGACVGMKGTRVQAVVQELRGEKIDIVPWTADSAEFVCRALAPAKVAKIIMDEDAKTMEVIVPDDQLSLAIGKKGQNVRLASRLSTWKLDVRSESEAEDEQRRARASLIAIPGINDITAEYLLQDGFKSAEKVAESDIETLAEIDGIGPERAETVLQAAREHVAALRQAEAEAAAAAAAAEAERVRTVLKTLEGIDDAAAEKLVAAGLTTVDAVNEAGASRLAEILGLDEEAAERIAHAAAAVAEAARRAAEEAAAAAAAEAESGPAEGEA